MKLSKTELLLGTALAAGIFAIIVYPALAEPDFSACPANTTCKTVLLTADQERTLLQMLETTCFTGPYAQVDGVVKFYQKLLTEAPSGKVAEKPKAGAVPP